MAVGRPEVDAEVRRVQGAPATRRIHLGLRAPGEQEQKQNAECGMRSAEYKWKVEPADRTSRAIPHSAFRTPHLHGSLARSRRKFSIPLTTPRAYRHCPSSLASNASCSGSMMNNPSVSAAGIHVGRTSA